MKNIKKIAALVLALVLVLSLTATAFAAEDLNTNGVVGDTDFTQDTPTAQDKAVNIKKELTVFNPDKAFVYGPAFTYTYTVTPGSDGKSITDDPSQHASGLATTSATLAGITKDLVVTTGSAGTTTSASGTLAWTNADILDADDAGAANYKNIAIDFTDVVFTQPGVYRYVITETPATSNTGYAAAGITETDGNRVRYLDVYVMRSSTYTTGGQGTLATDWMIYGYVCFYNNTDIDAADLSTEPIKTTGFVAGTSDGSTAIIADQYHTYNLKLGKTLTGDPTMASHEFPFDASWTNPSGQASSTFQFIVETTGNASITTGTTSVAATTSVNGTSVAAHTKVGGADAVTTSGKDGTPKIANGASVTYVGIPAAAHATVTETNDVVGTTYTTTVYDDEYDGTTAVPSTRAYDKFGSATTAALSTDFFTATVDQSETAVRVQGAPDSDRDAGAAPTAEKNVDIMFNNQLAVISPTGYAVRIAPYALMLVAGIFFFILMRRRREDESEAVA